MADTKEETIRKVPFLGDIPILGALFRRTQVEVDKTELLIFLTPHVAPEPGELLGMSREEMTGVEQMPDAIQPGVFDEFMDGLRLMGGPGAPRIWPGQKLPDGEDVAPSP
jgi:type II secretory pathway component GspD/PulD (secretin)